VVSDSAVAGRGRIRGPLPSPKLPPRLLPSSPLRSHPKETLASLRKPDPMPTPRACPRPGARAAGVTDRLGRGVAAAGGAALPSSPGARKAPLGRAEGQVAKAAEVEVEGAGTGRSLAASGRRQEMGGSGKARHACPEGDEAACCMGVDRATSVLVATSRRSLHGRCRRTVAEANDKRVRCALRRTVLHDR
jgi:hypothetical protein